MALWNCWISHFYKTSIKAVRQVLLSWHLVMSHGVFVFLLMLPFSVGCVFCDPKEPIRACTRFRARILLFNIEVPITQGFPVSESKNVLTHFALLKLYYGNSTSRHSFHCIAFCTYMFSNCCSVSMCAWRRYCCITRQSVSQLPLGNWLAFYIRAVVKSSRKNQSEFWKRGIVLHFTLQLCKAFFSIA